MTDGHELVPRLKEEYMVKSKVLENKRQKENALFSAAYRLFSTKGINNTAISDIVKKAGVGKGTFYLYFRDKHDIFEKIVTKKSRIILKEAYEVTQNAKNDDFIESIIFFTNYIVEYFNNNKILLRIVHKNLSWALYKKFLKDANNDKFVKDLSEKFIEGLEENNLGTEDVEGTLFIVIELVGSVCYSSIIHNEPVSIYNMKTILFNVIRKIFKN